MEQNVQQTTPTRLQGLACDGGSNCAEVKSVQGYTVYSLKNDRVALDVVPGLGARMISLKDLRTGREWMWHPKGGLNLFANRLHDDFSTSPLAGLDECLPTIAPCEWRSRQLPDHGEVWSMPWEVDNLHWAEGRLITRVRLPISPFEFVRTIDLRSDLVLLNYELKNLSTSEENYLWAMHPLLRTEPDDAIELPSSTSQLMDRKDWNLQLSNAASNDGCVKSFARPLRHGGAIIKNKNGRDRLEFIWNADENNTLGLWHTRGGWHGHHHFAIEPTNAADDSLAVAVTRGEGGRLPGHGTATWSVQLRIGL